MARIKLHVPAELVDPMYQELQPLWEDRSESIIESETGQLAHGSSPGALRRARAQRHAASELLDQVDWDSRRSDEPVELVGDHAFLDYVFRPLLHVVGERISEACQAAVNDGASIELIASHQRDLAMLSLTARPHNGNAAGPK